MHPPKGLSSVAYGLWATAHWVWQRRRLAKLQGMPFSEETVTENVLLDLTAICGGQISIQPFTKPEEAKTGADWEWCFVDLAAHRSFRALIQAKVLDNKDYQYSHIDRLIGNTHTRQIDRLLATAEARQVPALFAFYNHLLDTSRLPGHACSCCGGCVDCWGVSVALAQGVEALLPDKSFDTLCEISQPWACLACPPPEAPSDPLQASLRAVTELESRAFVGVRERGRTLRPGYARIRISDDVPSYVYNVLAARSGERHEGMAERFAAENPGVDGVVVVEVDRRAEAFSEDQQ